MGRGMLGGPRHYDIEKNGQRSHVKISKTQDIHVANLKAMHGRAI